MTRARLLPVATLFVIVAAPLAWLACGGGTKPPETPATEGSASASSEAPAASDAPAPADSASSAPDTSSASSDATPASAPPPPLFGSTDCGKCVDKTCSKQEAACGKNSDCQSALDTIHGCSSSAATCIGSATSPTAAKPKKLAAAYEACAKKATSSKACKAKCQ